MRTMEKLKSNLVTVAVIFFIIAILMPIFILVLYVVPYPDSINGIMRVDNIGSTADFLAGTMTPFLTIAAFFLLLKGYFMQKEELAQTREEMKKSAEALEQQRNIMEEDKNLSKSQKDFEFCITLINDLRDTFKNIEIACLKIRIKDKKVIFYEKNYEKRDLYSFFNILANIIRQNVDGVKDWEGLSKIKNEKLKKGNLKDYAEFVIHSPAFNYYSKLYFLLSFIDNQIKDKNIKYLALKYLAVNLTLGEKIILFYINGIAILPIEEENNKFNDLLIKYKRDIIILDSLKDTEENVERM